MKFLLGDKAHEEKPEEVEAMESRLTEMIQRMEKLKERLEMVRGEVKSELERRTDAATASQEEQRRRLHQFQDTSLEK